MITVIKIISTNDKTNSLANAIKITRITNDNFFINVSFKDLDLISMQI